jgi:hypothetical protein
MTLAAMPDTNSSISHYFRRQYQRAPMEDWLAKGKFRLFVTVSFGNNAGLNASAKSARTLLSVLDFVP